MLEDRKFTYAEALSYAIYELEEQRRHYSQGPLGMQKLEVASAAMYALLSFNCSENSQRLLHWLNDEFYKCDPVDSELFKTLFAQLTRFIPYRSPQDEVLGGRSKCSPPPSETPRPPQSGRPGGSFRATSLYNSHCFGRNCENDTYCTCLCDTCTPKNVS